jgi:predicted cytidylate kinase
MTTKRSVVINGDLGSGKTTVSVGVAERLGLRRISIGDLYRRMAHERGMTALQLNLHAELDDEVDGYVDQLQRGIAESGEQLVVDSRLAWAFFKNAFKVHLITDPTVAAARVLARPANDVERYESVEEAEKRLRSRSDSERARFISRYGVDKHRLRNYDLVCDTTRATPDEIIEQIVAAFEGRLGAWILRDAPPLLLLDPCRIFPTIDVDDVREVWDSGLASSVAAAGPMALEPISVGRAESYFFALDGHQQLSAAVRNNFTLVPATLIAELAEPVAGGLTADRYFAAECDRRRIHEWEQAHKIELPLPDRLPASLQETPARPPR